MTVLRHPAATAGNPSPAPKRARRDSSSLRGGNRSGSRRRNDGPSPSVFTPLLESLGSLLGRGLVTAVSRLANQALCPKARAPFTTTPVSGYNIQYSSRPNLRAGVPSRGGRNPSRQGEAGKITIQGGDESMAHQLPDSAVSVRRPRAAHRQADDGDPPRQAPQDYVNNLNAALEGHPELQSKSAGRAHRRPGQPCPEAIRTAVRNNGGGHANHTMFWEIMAPNGGGEPDGRAGRGDQQDLRRLRRRSRRSSPRPRVGPLRQRLGLARRGQGRQAGRHQHRQPGQPHHGGRDARSSAWTCGSTPTT